MSPDKLIYSALKPLLSKYEDKGRGESIAFLNWFLENIFRLDGIDADDCICDRPNDRGVDGIYVNHTQETVTVLQGKLKQKDSTFGDAGLRNLAGTLTQFENAESIQAILDSGAHPDLKRLINRSGIKGLVDNGYTLWGAYITNQAIDKNGQEFVDQTSNIIVFDKDRISSDFIDVDIEGGVNGEFTFDTSYVEPIRLTTGTLAQTYVYPVKATELVQLAGIDDGTLFSQNVRQSLGNTKVNKALRASVLDSDEHEKFPLYHNGVNILCSEVVPSADNQSLTIKNYVVVNGAQSISTFKKNAGCLTDDLRVFAKIVQLKDADLAKKITVNSNNQNAIKPRDLKSTNEVQLRLKADFQSTLDGLYDLEIKRGQECRAGSEIITNEEAGRLLLAFDLNEPYTCHQVYKLFDDKYTEIFARPEVTAYRVIFLKKVMERISMVMDSIDSKPLSRYGLTRFFLLSTIGEILKKTDVGTEVWRAPEKLFTSSKLDEFLTNIDSILTTIVIDLNYEVQNQGDGFDYKGDLKSPVKVKDLRENILKSYDKDVARNKATDLSKEFSLTP